MLGIWNLFLLNIKINFEDYTYIDWFYEKGVVIKNFTQNNKTKEFEVSEKLFKPKEGFKGIIGKGDCDIEFPFFSLSTPIICVEETTKKKYIWVLDI